MVNLDIAKPMMNEIKLYKNIPVQCKIYKSYEHYVKDFPKKKMRDEERGEKKMKRSHKKKRKSTGGN